MVKLYKMNEKALKHILDEIFEGTAYIYSEVFTHSLSPEKAQEELDNLKNLVFKMLKGVIKNEVERRIHKKIPER